MLFAKLRAKLVWRKAGDREVRSANLGIACMLKFWNNLNELDTIKNCKKMLCENAQIKSVSEAWYSYGVWYKVFYGRTN